MSESRLCLLQAMPIFGGIEEATLHFILDRSNCVEVSRDRDFFREGELAHSLFVLETGEVAIFRTLNGERHELRVLGPGDCFGEMALMDCKPRSATAKAVQDCRAIEMTTTLFGEIHDRYPQQFTLIQMNMGREVSRRLRDADRAR